MKTAKPEQVGGFRALLGTFDELERLEEYANERRMNVDEERVAKYAEAVKIVSESRTALMGASVRADPARADCHRVRLHHAKETIRAFRRDVNRERRAAREAKFPFVAGVWEQGWPDRELCPWSRHATAGAAKAAARRYARRMRSEGPTTGGARSWSGGWRGPTGDVNWIEFAGGVDAR